MANYFVQVETYNKSGLALLQNKCPLLSLANKKFKGFDRQIPANKGSSVSFDLPPRMIVADSLVASWQDVEQRQVTLTCDQEASVSYSFDTSQFIFNAREYMDRFGASAIAALGAKIEQQLGTNIPAKTWRYYGSTATGITSFSGLANAVEKFRETGTVRNKTVGVLPTSAVPDIVNNGLGQFVPARNDKMANSWELGMFDGCEWYTSNLLPTHTAGTEGQAASTLTVVSVTKNSDDAVTSITFSGCSAASDADSVKAYDKFVFNDGVSGQPNLRYLTEVGHVQTSSNVQFAATADAASTAGSQVTVSINPPLKASAGINQNINKEIVAGMQCSVLDSHKCGLLMCDSPLFVAMPQLPDEVPFPTSNVVDPVTGASLRQYFGTDFGQNFRGMVHDCLWGSQLVGSYAMLLVFKA